MISKKRKRYFLSFSQIFILVFSIVSFAYLINEIDSVNAQIDSDQYQQSEEDLTTTEQHTPNPVGLLGTGTELTKRIVGGGTKKAVLSTGKMLAGNALYAVGIYYTTKFVMDLTGASPETSSAVSIAAAAGYFAGSNIHGMLANGGILSGGEYGVVAGHAQSFLTFGGALGPTSAALVWGGVVFVGVLLATYKKEKTKIITFTCKPWNPATGGARCQECNKGTLPCNEYQCRALGQGCELIENKCIWKNEKDSKPPIITPNKEILLQGYKYIPDNAVSPPNAGVQITKEDGGCISPFTKFKFGITTDEPTHCKYSVERKEKFDEMTIPFGTGDFGYNHTQILYVPFEINGTMNDNINMYIKCMDGNGNYNIADFVFKFCIEKGPDLNAPIIEATSIKNGQYIAYEKSSVDLKIEVDKPATCKWANNDKDYKDMENEMTCLSNEADINDRMNYECTTTLTGLKSRQDNKFYFRCKSYPGKDESERVTNTQSTEFVLKGSQPLVITQTAPNGTIRDSSAAVKVVLEIETSAGANEGKAYCYFSETGEYDSYILFSETNTNTHSQELRIPTGTYTYYIKCIDDGGNTDTKTVSFKTESDLTSPKVVRIYHEDNNLKIITSEKGNCVFSRENCNYLFDDGIEMQSSDGKEHFIEWNTNANYYIRCEDDYRNQPLPNECSIIARMT